MESAEDFVYRTYYKEMDKDFDIESKEIFHVSIENHVKELEIRDAEIEEKAYKAAMATIPDGGASCKMCMSNIKKECADRAVVWYTKDAGPELLPMYEAGVPGLRAAIEGGRE